MYGYAFHRALRYRAESWFGNSGRAYEVKSIFSKRLDRSSKVIQGLRCYRHTLLSPNLVAGTSHRSVIHWWGQRLCRSQPGSTQEQISQECPVTTKFDRKNPSLGVNQPDSTRVQIAKKCSMATKFDGKNLRPKKNAVMIRQISRRGHQSFKNALSVMASKFGRTNR